MLLGDPGSDVLPYLYNSDEADTVIADYWYLPSNTQDNTLTRHGLFSWVTPVQTPFHISTTLRQPGTYILLITSIYRLTRKITHLNTPRTIFFGDPGSDILPCLQLPQPGVHIADN